MIIRNGKDFNIRICFPVILKYCQNVEAYWAVEDKVRGDISLRVAEDIPTGYNFSLEVNTPRDMLKTKAMELYAVVGGSALDYGEEGLVGRGNNRSGIIPTFRSSSMEAAFGKNPVYHVGKVLGLVADAVSSQIFEETGMKNEIVIVAKNGDSLLRPSQITISGSNQTRIADINKVVEKVLARTDWTSRIVDTGLLVPKTGNLMLKSYDAKRSTF